ncbi:MAG: DUF5597 domain-containing protein [Phycisphaerae bacterium]|nr:DUF5597 domain-containing protein [Phycisphaerae bacterium]
MRTRPMTILLSAVMCLLFSAASAPAAVPHLAKKGTATQLIVDGRPFVMLAGELHNSSASSLEYMEPMWDRLVALRLNTVLATVCWELVEPQEGRFDFSLVDGLIAGARARDLKLVLLWFASWKNGVSSYPPPWVKADLQRFPRAQGEKGNNKDVLSPFHEESCRADARAFAAMMRHLRQADPEGRTVIMIQVENEIGIMPESRDHSPAANQAFQSAVPRELMSYLAAHQDTLLPEIKALWESTGFRESGTWREVFGDSIWTDEVFMAWHMAAYVGKVTRTGKAEHPLPMYANAWLVQNDRQVPGNYPSGGPVSRVMDIWRAAAPEVDFLAPDIYLTDFKAVCESYVRSGNPLMIPEARQGPEAARNVFWAVAEHDAMCFAPFGIEDNTPDHPMVASYEILHQLMPLITERHGAGRMAGILQQDPKEEGTTIDLPGYRANVRYNRNAKDQTDMAYGLILQLAPDEFLVAGNWFSVNFSPLGPGPRRAGILQVWEGRYENGRWLSGRCLNGDETAAHWQAKLPPNEADRFAGSTKPRILRVTLYRHD